MIIASRRNPLAHAIDFALTLAAWCVLLYLLLHGLIQVSSGGLDAALPRLYLTDWSAAGTLGGYLATALLNALLLFSWARYNQRRFERAARRGAFKPVSPEELCRKFILTERQYKKLQVARKVVFDHDDRGRIVDMVASDLTVPSALVAWQAGHLLPCQKSQIVVTCPHQPEPHPVPHA